MKPWPYAPASIIALSAVASYAAFGADHSPVEPAPAVASKDTVPPFVPYPNGLYIRNAHTVNNFQGPKMSAAEIASANKAIRDADKWLKDRIQRP